MPIEFTAMTPSDTDVVVRFLAGNHFPFHVQATPEAASIRASIEKGRFWNPDTQGY